MTRSKRITAILYAIAAAAFYAISTPCSKILLGYVKPTVMAGLLYLGAGVGIGALLLINVNGARNGAPLTKADMPYTVGMVALDVAAPIFLMLGLAQTTSASVSLLNNFEIVATTVIAFFAFREAVSRRLWIAIALVTLSSAVLSLESPGELRFSWGSLLVLLAAVCWGLENNCTRSISSKNTYEIVTIKGICSGLGSLVVGFIMGETLPEARYITLVMLLGFVAYGLSIFYYIKAQRELGAAKTSAYYAIAPFIGVLLSFILLKEPFSAHYFIALVLMLVGSGFAVADTLGLKRAA